jgi:hypothetical protein
VEILKTPIAEVTADHRPDQSHYAKSGKIEVPNKLGALQLLAKMCGWNEPERVKVQSVEVKRDCPRNLTLSL